MVTLPTKPGRWPQPNRPALGTRGVAEHVPCSLHNYSQAATVVRVMLVATLGSDTQTATSPSDAEALGGPHASHGCERVGSLGPAKRAIVFYLLPDFAV